MLAFRAQTASLKQPAGLPYAPAFRGQSTGLGAMMNAHDGQAFASLALDPLLSRASEWSGGNAEVAYRAARPLLSALVAPTSFGSRARAGWGLLAWTAVGVGVLAGGAGALATVWGRRSEWVPLVLVVPGVVGQLWYGGLPDSLATGLALLGMAWWLEHRDRRAIVALSLAALAKETTLLVPLALALASARPRARRLAVPFAAYAGWVGLVWVRLRALPSDAGHALLGPPLTGLVSGIRSWGWVETVGALSIAVLAATALRRGPRHAEVRWLVAVSAAFASVMGADVWRSWDFTRSLLPVTVVGACLLARRTAAGAGRDQLEDWSPSATRS